MFHLEKTFSKVQLILGLKSRSPHATASTSQSLINPLNTPRDTKGNYGNEKQQLSAIIEARKLQAVKERLQNEVLLSERWTGCFTVVASLSLKECEAGDFTIH
uniref:Uncharacterized protein n=1 Tax=Salix viminalis TaxID=40686 RepID=A0A6N2M2K8_SALVM